MNECRPSLVREYAWGNVQDDGAQQEVEKHIRQCEKCAQIYEHALALRRATSEYSQEEVCPDSEALAVFRRDELSPAEHDAVKQHLQWCGDCQKALEFLELVMETSDTQSESAAVQVPPAETTIMLRLSELLKELMVPRPETELATESLRDTAQPRAAVDRLRPVGETVEQQDPLLPDLGWQETFYVRMLVSPGRRILQLDFIPVEVKGGRSLRAVISIDGNRQMEALDREGRIRLELPCSLQKESEAEAITLRIEPAASLGRKNRNGVQQ